MLVVVPTSGVRAQNAALVGVDEVRTEVVSQTFPVIGRLVARRFGVVAARVGGPVGELRVEVGDRVAKDQVVAVLVRERLRWERERKAADVSERQAELASRQTQLVIKNQELRRLERLRKNKSAAFRQAQYADKRQEGAMLNSQVAEAKARLKRARADLRLAEIDLEYAQIRAPFPGVVTQRHTEAGAFLGIGQPVVTLVDDSELEVEADVPAERIGGLRPGASIRVQINGATVQAEVRAVVPQENPMTRTRAVRFTADLGKLRGRLATNQSVTADIPISAPHDVVSVHKDAILNRRGGNMVFVVKDGKASPRKIAIGDAVGGRFVVQNGLKPGEIVVVRGNERLFPGQPVRF